MTFSEVLVQSLEVHGFSWELKRPACYSNMIVTVNVAELAKTNYYRLACQSFFACITNPSEGTMWLRSKIVMDAFDLIFA